MPLVRYSDIIHGMRRGGKSIAAVHKELQSRNVDVSYYKVRIFLQKHHSTHLPCKESPYQPRSLAPIFSGAMNIINNSYSSSSSSTIPSILKRLKEHNMYMSASQVRQYRERLGYKRTTTNYCHMIRDVNKDKRFTFCTIMIELREDFVQCIFTDEYTIQIDCSVKYCYVKKGDYFAKMRSKAKHPAKLHLWGGISTRGATKLAIFPGEIRMDSEKYCRILSDCYIPFNKDKYNGYGILVQDNAPAHKSGYTTTRLAAWNASIMDWPPESPDLNPIELVWGNLKTFVRKQDVRTLDGLREAVEKYWCALTPEVCKRYIDGIAEKMRRVVEQEGRNIYEGR